MHVTIAAIGKMKPGPERSLFDNYTTRLPWNVTLEEREEKRNLPSEKRIIREGELLLSAAPEGAVTIALDERGKHCTSQQFAEKLQYWQEEYGRAAFLIGGANGHGERVKQSADFMLSLGPMTLPHMLARVVLAEQLYRAWSILSNHPYHRE